MMLRRTVVLFATAALLGPIVSAPVGAQVCKESKVAFVNIQAILGSIPKYVQADSQLTAEQNAYSVELQQGRGRLDSMSQAYQDKATLLSATQKAAEQKKLQDEATKLQSHAQDLQQKLTDERQQLMQPTENKVGQILDGLRAEQNCAMVFDVSSQSAIASADKSLDLTPMMLDRLRKSGDIPAAPTTPTTPPAPPPVKPPAGQSPATR